MHRPVILAPTYNNAGTLREVIERIESLGLPLMVINDGSTDATREILANRPGTIHHDINRGKAAALLTGFDAARAAGYTHAATIDTDGQHDPADLPSLLDASRANPAALILGARAESIDGYPAKNRLGRRLSNLAIRWQSGARISDSQCGLRIYPFDLMQRLRVRAGRYGFEAEVITRAAWVGAPILEVPVSCQYPPTRVSHFRPGADSLRALLMHARLLLESLRRPRAHPAAPAPAPSSATPESPPVTPRSSPSDHATAPAPHHHAAR